jgi:fucose permease
MEKQNNTKVLFNACSLALVVSALTFSIRANILDTLGQEFGLSASEVGGVASAAFWGFTLAIFAGGLLCDKIGIGSLYLTAFICHIAGVVFTILSLGFWTLFLSTFLIGLANGFIESASYSMVSSIYPNEKAKKINAWLIWFPTGVVIGGMIAYGLSNIRPGDWKLQMMFIIFPILGYGFMFFNQKFPKSERMRMGVSDKKMAKECTTPLFIFMLLCMSLTTATELGTNQWIAGLLSNVGVPAILLLVFINGIMAIGRANAGVILKKFSSTGLLLLSAILSFLGLIGLGFSQGYLTFIAAGVFAMGICFFWPTMIGFVSENLPQTGPLGLSLMGGMGLLSAALVFPFVGEIYEHQISLATRSIDLNTLKNVADETTHAAILAQTKSIAGSHTLRFMTLLPAILIIAFTYLHYKGKGIRRIGVLGTSS